METYIIQRVSRDKEATGLLHVSDRLLAGELSRVEAARGTLCPLRDSIPKALITFVLIDKEAGEKV